ncbi:MAG: adenylate/guanylate cyclase domain-containing protein [Chitinophagaceae bacterium]|nr:MAG: adenylate/guanylate cyclase domain-containing protein [Chitinophagaceae bacterium]
MAKDRTLPVFKRYQRKWVVLISLAWAIIDLLRLMVIASGGRYPDHPFIDATTEAVALRFVLVWVCSALLIYFVLMRFKGWFNTISLFVANLLKGVVLCVGIAVMNIVIFEVLYLLNDPLSLHLSLRRIGYHVFETNWLVDNILFWILVIIPTQLLLEINEKYSPGVFLEIFFGKYIQPREEERIIMFIDLKDSTPIAEQLGHKRYFLFIRDFIHYVSTAMLEYNGRIYQYVGDEVVVSWKMGKHNKDNKACIQALIAARKLLQKEGHHFRQKYNITPDFRVGMHTGKVMVGEIGVIKKDLAMSGDAMNTTARIRSATSELNHRFVMSKDFVDRIDLEGFQAQSLGPVDLKGKEGSVELFSLHI